MDNFLGFKTEEILTFLLLIVVGYAIAKMFSGCGCSSGNGFSVGAPSQCRDTSMGFNTICRGSQQWDGGRRDFSCPTEDIPNKNIRKNWCPDFCNFDGGDARCPTDSNDPLCTGVTSLNIPGIHKDSSGQWVNQCIKGPASPPPTPPAPAPTPPAPTPPAPTPPAPAPVDENCTYTGDNKTKTISKSFKDYVKEEKLDELECPDVQIKIDECKDAWRNYYNDKGVQYDGSFCMQTLPDETIDDKSKGRGHCPLMHDANGKPYPANWITNGQKFTIDDAKNRCKLSYLDGDPVGTIDEQENAPGRYAWVSETNNNDCDCPESPTPKPKIICKDKNLMDGTSNPGKKKGDCPTQTPDQTCCYDTTTQDTDFYEHYKEETKNMIQKCENDPHGSFTGPKSNQDVINLGFPRLTGKYKENELFCYYNDNQKHPGEHRDYCDSNSEYENGHGYFCSFSSNKKHNRNKHNIRDLKHKRNALRDQLSQLETQA